MQQPATYLVCKCSSACAVTPNVNRPVRRAVCDCAGSSGSVPFKVCQRATTGSGSGTAQQNADSVTTGSCVTVLPWELLCIYGWTTESAVRNTVRSCRRARPQDWSILHLSHTVHHVVIFNNLFKSSSHCLNPRVLCFGLSRTHQRGGGVVAIASQKCPLSRTSSDNIAIDADLERFRAPRGRIG